MSRVILTWWLKYIFRRMYYIYRKLCINMENKNYGGRWESRRENYVTPFRELIANFFLTFDAEKSLLGGYDYSDSRALHATGVTRWDCNNGTLRHCIKGTVAQKLRKENKKLLHLNICILLKRIYFVVALDFTGISHFYYYLHWSIFPGQNVIPYLHWKIMSSGFNCLTFFSYSLEISWIYSQLWPYCIFN